MSSGEALVIAGGSYDQKRWASMHTAKVAPGSEPPAGGEQSPLVWQRLETLGVADVVMTILEARKAMPWATAATVSRARHGDAVHVRVSLLGSPATGTGEVIAAFAVRKLGEDLATAFGDKDVITLK